MRPLMDTCPKRLEGEARRENMPSLRAFCGWRTPGLAGSDIPFDFDFPEGPLAGRVVLVAGGTGGLGSATVALLARESAQVVAGFPHDPRSGAALEPAAETRN